jgi:hypothetical protein
MNTAQQWATQQNAKYGHNDNAKFTVISDECSLLEWHDRLNHASFLRNSLQHMA